MPNNSIEIICGADGLSAEAAERIRRHATHDELVVNIHQSTSPGEWVRLVEACAASCRGLVLSPDVSDADQLADREALYLALANACRNGVLLAEVYEDNIFRSEHEVRPLQPAGCHVRFICGLGAAGYLLAIDALVTAGELQ